MIVILKLNVSKLTTTIPRKNVLSSSAVKITLAGQISDKARNLDRVMDTKCK